MIASLRSRLAAWTAAETAEGVPRPPPRLSFPPRVIDAALVAVVAALNTGYLLSSVYIHAAAGGGRPRARACRLERTRRPGGDLPAGGGRLVVAARPSRRGAGDRDGRPSRRLPYPSLFAFLALYSAALRLPLRTALLAGTATAVCRFVGVAGFRGSVELGDLASAVTTSGMAVAAGLYVAARRAYMARLRERALFARALASFLPPDVTRRHGPSGRRSPCGGGWQS